MPAPSTAHFECYSFLVKWLVICQTHYSIFQGGQVARFKIWSTDVWVQTPSFSYSCVAKCVKVIALTSKLLCLIVNVIFPAK